MIPCAALVGVFPSPCDHDGDANIGELMDLGIAAGERGRGTAAEQLGRYLGPQLPGHEHPHDRALGDDKGDAVRLSRNG